MKKPQIPEQVLEYFRTQGRIGGKRRAEKLSPEQRVEIARNAINARWKKSKLKKKSKTKK